LFHPLGDHAQVSLRHRRTTDQRSARVRCFSTQTSHQRHSEHGAHYRIARCRVLATRTSLVVQATTRLRPWLRGESLGTLTPTTDLSEPPAGGAGLGFGKRKDWKTFLALDGPFRSGRFPFPRYARVQARSTTVRQQTRPSSIVFDYQPTGQGRVPPQTCFAARKLDSDNPRP